MGSRKPGAQLRQVNQHLKFTVQLASYEGINPLESQKFGVTSSTGQAMVYNAENASPHTLSEQPSNLTWCQNRERRWNQTSLYRTAKLQTNIGQLQFQRGSGRNIWVPIAGTSRTTHYIFQAIWFITSNHADPWKGTDFLFSHYL